MGVKEIHESSALLKGIKEFLLWIFLLVNGR